MGLMCDQQKQHPVYYDEHHIGTLIPDLIVEEKIIVDPKVVAGINDNHLAQMLGYMNITGLKTALLFNFKFVSFDVKRFSN